MNKYSPKCNLALYLLCGGELIERFSYFGILTVLVLDLHKLFHFTDEKSFSIFGLFLSLSYALLVLGGYGADKWFGSRHSLSLGGLLLISGNLLLACKNVNFFYTGLALIIMGTSLFKVTCTSLTGKLFHEGDLTRERAFTIFYSCMNIGGMLSPIVYGIIMSKWGQSWCFILSAVLLVIATIALGSNSFIKSVTVKETKCFFAYSIMVLVLGGIFLCFIFSNISNIAIITLFVISLAMLIRLAFRQASNSRRKLFALFILNCGCIAFFACSLQVASSVTLFIQRDIHKVIFGVPVPTSAFSSLDPLFVVVMAPLFVGLWKILSNRGIVVDVVTKISVGIALASLAFIGLYLAARTSMSANYYLPVMWIFVANILLGSGEISLSPAVLSAVTKLAPENLQSTMTGAWYLFTAFGGYLAGQLSKFSDLKTSMSDSFFNIAIYETAFLKIALFAIVAAAIVYFLKPLVKYLAQP